jgi:hypothetical protein
MTTIRRARICREWEGQRMGVMVTRETALILMLSSQSED